MIIIIKCYFFTDTSELKSAFLSTFFNTNFVICKDMHLHIPKPNVEFSDEESSNSKMSILVIAQRMEGVVERRVEPSQRTTLQLKKEFK